MICASCGNFIADRSKMIQGNNGKIYDSYGCMMQDNESYMNPFLVPGSEQGPVESQENEPYDGG